MQPKCDARIRDNERFKTEQLCVRKSKRKHVVDKYFDIFAYFIVNSF